MSLVIKTIHPATSNIKIALLLIMTNQGTGILKSVIASGEDLVKTVKPIIFCIEAVLLKI